MVNQNILNNYKSVSMYVYFRFTLFTLTVFYILIKSKQCKQGKIFNSILNVNHLLSIFPYLRFTLQKVNNRLKNRLLNQFGLHCLPCLHLLTYTKAREKFNQ
jgi:hypothetical protein